MNPCENGWWEMHSTDEIRHWALDKVLHGDTVQPYYSVAHQKKRCRGLVAEKLFHDWLRYQEVDFHANGGIDKLPDVVINSQNIGVRMRASRKFQRDYLVFVFHRHKGMWDEWFFLGFEESLNRYLLLGGISETAFFSQATFVEPGASLCPGFVAEEPMWSAKMSVLETPVMWLNRVT